MIPSIKRNPAFLLLLFVYFWILPICLSYQNSWIHPEELYIKSSVLNTGINLNFKDIKNGLSWELFEYQPRPTRPLSSYFEILDTKFRCWLWHYIMPHPSLSLTWIFSLILGPLFLYKLLKNFGISLNTAVTLIAFYLVTCGVLSHEAMLFRPGKPMANFSIILCLYLSSKLKKGFLDKGSPIPLKRFLILWAITAVSFYWDETALLIFPAVLFMFPSIFSRKSFLALWLLLPLMILLAYLEIIPYLCAWAGHPWPHLLQYPVVQAIGVPVTFQNFINYFGINSRNLILGTMGIFPFSSNASKLTVISMSLAAIAWVTILFYIARIRKSFDSQLIFLLFLLFVFNAILSVTICTDGPYYYGSFWSIFFVIYLSKHIEKANIPKITLFIVFFLIIINAANSFNAVNVVYKKHHWYGPNDIRDFFSGKKVFFDQQERPFLTDKEIRSAITKYSTLVKNRINIDSLTLPRELGWLPLELEGNKAYDVIISRQEDQLHQPYYYTFKRSSSAQTVFDYNKANPNLEDFYYSRGNNRFKQGNFDLAVSDYTEAIKIRPNDANPYNNRGLAYYNLGWWAQAFSDYNKAIEIDPSYADAYYNRGLALDRQGDQILALSDFDKAIQITPGNGEIYSNRAIIYYRLKEYDKSWVDVHKAEELGAVVNPQLISALKAAPR